MRPPERHRAIIASSVAWMDALFDADAGLLRYPSAIRRHAVRESLWYAAGLLVLGRNGVALRIIDAVLALQFDRPGAVWHGTWPRAPGEPEPGDGAVIWRDYDPNWRQFIGCLLAVLMRDCAEVLGSERCDRAREAIARAIRGEPVDRIVASYSNIALMQAWLLCEYGDRSHGERLAAHVERLYRDEGGFHEFNSPTYYGVDLWGLALWRRSSSTALAEAAPRLEAALWGDIAAFYHPGMRNLCGPYDRAYGMDMTRYASLIGLWLWWTCGDETRAFPDVSQPFDHAHDFCAAPLLAFAPPSIPAEISSRLSMPLVDHAVERRVSRRTITATLRRDLMLGAVDRASLDPTGQATPITAHWYDAVGGIAWLCIRGELSARVTETQIIVRSASELSMQCAGGSNNAFSNGAWVIGGRRIEVAGLEISMQQGNNDGTHYALKVTSGEAVLRFA